MGVLCISPLDFNSDHVKGFLGGERLLLRKTGFYMTGMPVCKQGVYFLIH